ncbi:hypothetical protein [Micromonospora sp. LOL_023]|uniref:hypothetical protein n=1 Tax=Micromonospora sp. LOL_023 TaxID=3345418 RepID=UPI003A8A243F
MSATRAKVLGYCCCLVVILTVLLRWVLISHRASSLREGQNLEEMFSGVNDTVTRAWFLFSLTILAVTVTVGALWWLARQVWQPSDWMVKLHWFTAGSAALFVALCWSLGAKEKISGMQQLRPEDSAARAQDVSVAVDRIANLPLPKPSFVSIALLLCWLAIALLLLGGARRGKNLA